MDHYYSVNPDAASDPHSITVAARGIRLTLTVDRGVFSTKGLDFGTRVLVETVQLPETGLVLDLGCGYGAVSALLARVYPKTRWIALDINQRAIQLASLNLGGLGERVSVRQSDGLEAVDVGTVDAVLLNPPIRAGKAIVYRLFEESRDALCEGASLWTVIHKKHGAKSAADYLNGLFSSVELRERESGYHVFECVR
jgi:16S rRNA (guanine1207-N2)-methyltransferase